MERRNTLSLVALLALLPCGVLAWHAVQGDPTADTAPAPEKRVTEKERAAKWADLRGKGAPEKAQKVKGFLGDRWGHTGEVGKAAVSMDIGGDMVFFEKDLIVGMQAGGKKVYARAASRPIRYTGPVMNRKNKYQFPAAISTKKLPGGNLKGRLPTGRVPLDELPGSGFKKPRSDS